MALATITLIGLYNYDHTLFDNLIVPEEIDKEILVDNILLKSGEFESLYSSLPFVKNAIGIWSNKWYPTFEKWVEALALEYNPIENYDRIEEWTDTNTGTQTVTNTGTQTDTNTGTETTTDTGTSTTVGTGSEDTTKTGSIKDQQGGGTTTENQVSAYDSSTYAPKDKQIFSTTQSNETTFNQAKDTHTLNNLQNQRTDDLTHERTDDLTHERTDDLTQERTDDLTAGHEGRIHGNIGVTTSQQMLESEMQLRLKWNLIEQITDLFLQEFVIPVY